MQSSLSDDVNLDCRVAPGVIDRTGVDLDDWHGCGGSVSGKSRDDEGQVQIDVVMRGRNKETDDSNKSREKGGGDVGRDPQVKLCWAFGEGWFTYWEGVVV